MTRICRAKRFLDPEPRQSWAIHLSPGVGGRGLTGPGVHSHRIGALLGGLATWPERFGHLAWWRGG